MKKITFTASLKSKGTLTTYVTVTVKLFKNIGKFNHKKTDNMLNIALIIWYDALNV